MSIEDVIWLVYYFYIYAKNGFAEVVENLAIIRYRSESNFVRSSK